MAFRNGTVAAVLVVSMASGMGLAQTPKPDCGEVVDTAQREMRAFSREATGQSMKFAVDLDMDEQLSNAKRVLALRNPGAAARDEIQRLKEQVDAYRAKMRTYAQLIADIAACLRPYDSACMGRVTAQSDAEIKAWLSALTEYTSAEAAERARKAAELINTWHDRAFNLATGTMTASVGCLTEFQRQIPAPTTESAAPVAVPPDASLPEVAEPPSKPVITSSGDSGALWAIAAGGGTVGALLLYHNQKQAGGGGGSCRQPSSNPLSICASQGGSSSACIQSLSEWDTYCRQCQNSSGFNRQRGTCQ